MPVGWLYSDAVLGVMLINTGFIVLDETNQEANCNGNKSMVETDRDAV